MTAPGRIRVYAAVAFSVFLFGLNAAICHKLFAIEFTSLNNNAGAFMALGRFYRDHWREIGWLPWFDAGKPIENAYQPMLPALIAALSWVSGWSIPRCYQVA